MKISGFLELACGIRIIAHRGGYSNVADSAYESYLLAVRHKTADFLECDISITSDQEFICNHSPALKKSTNIKDFPDLIKTPRRLEVLDPILGQKDQDADYGWYSPDHPYHGLLDHLSSLTDRNESSYLRFATMNDLWELVNSTYDEYPKEPQKQGITGNLDSVIGLYLEIKNSLWFNTKRNIDIVSEFWTKSIKPRARHLGPGLYDFPVPIYIQSFNLVDLIRLRKLIGYESKNIFLTGLFTQSSGTPPEPLIYISARGSYTGLVPIRIGKIRRRNPECHKIVDMLNDYLVRVPVQHGFFLGYELWLKNYNFFVDCVVDALGFAIDLIISTPNVVEDSQSKGFLVHTWTIKNLQ